MQFIKNGPDIPERLLQAHEDGRVVFFCGAGISYPAGLPGFGGLVEQIFEKLGVHPDAVQKAAIKAGQFDTAIGLLESTIVGGRKSVRRELVNILTPTHRPPSATAVHEALLTLSRNREGQIRLITTNFDRLFEEVITNKKFTIERFQAPLLPVPKNRWDGLVYLHGLISSELSDSSLDRLVVSSGDFGLAYLTERWASRFVSELFRSYVVCFIGYSINDPVMRYMMDALAADRLLGESPPEMFAFACHAKNKEEECENEWLAKNVTPILYHKHRKHYYLHKSLWAWAESYRDGVSGKEQIIVQHAISRPQDSTLQDNYISRMLWALSDKSGLPAKRFAELNPVPSLDWLDVFATEHYHHEDLIRFGISPHAKIDGDLRFSLLRRPVPYDQAPRMSLASGGSESSRWDEVMVQMARWLVRHLNDPDLILWLAQQGGQLHEQLIRLIEAELDKVVKLEKDGDTAELERIRSNAPNAVPQPLMRALWRLLLTGRVKSPWRDWDIFRWKSCLKRDGLTTTLRLKLRELLAPKIALKKPFHWAEDESPEEPKSIRQLVDWELVLAGDHTHSSLRDLTDKSWNEYLSALLDDFQQLLRDALDLLRELGVADNHSDRSYWDIPSISPHRQNLGFRDWVALIELLRDAWLAIRENDSDLASRIALAWFTLPYPTFKRLALFAASQDACIAPDQWGEWLMADDAWWLWSVETQRETMRLLVLQGANLNGEVRDQLEAAILSGPPRKMFLDDLEPGRWEHIVDRNIWLRLSKLESAGGSLGEDARIRLASISKAHTEWKLSDNERDEFSHWMSSTGDPDYEDQRQIEIAPRNRRELVQWLQRIPPKDIHYEDTWSQTCRERFYACAMALCDLAHDHQWPVSRWREALQAWSDEKLVARSWHFIAPVIKFMPEVEILELVHSLSWWLKMAANTLDRYDDIFLVLCQRILELDHKDEEERAHPVTEAINHPVGHVTQALLDFWFRREPTDNQGLPDDLIPLFTQLCDTQVDQYRHGRVVMASQLIAFFRVDQRWTQEHLLPLFEWTSPTAEASFVWEGFLRSPRLYSPLLKAFKTDLLETARHCPEIGEHGRQYISFLTYAALDPADTFTTAELNDAFSALSKDGLRDSASALVNALEGAGEQREQYWLNRVKPFWGKIWPKSRELISKPIAESLAHLVIAAQGEFPEALATIKDWLLPLDHPHYIIHLLHEATLSNRFPDESLYLIDAISNDQSWPSEELVSCLDQIVKASPSLARDRRMVRLRDYLRRKGAL